MPGAGGKYGGGVKLTVQLFVSKRCIETELSKSSWNGVGESRHLLYGSREVGGRGGGGGCFSAAETGFIHSGMQPRRQADRNGDRSTESEKVLLLSYGLRYV